MSQEDVYKFPLRNRTEIGLSSFFLIIQNEISGYEFLFQGTIDRAAVPPREIVKAAIDNNAYGDFGSQPA
jgi:DNA repair protein RadC